MPCCWSVGTGCMPGVRRAHVACAIYGSNAQPRADRAEKSAWMTPSRAAVLASP